MKTKRKIIQIAVVPEGAHTYSGMLFLCDDGTVWMKKFFDNKQPAPLCADVKYIEDYKFDMGGA